MNEPTEERPRLRRSRDERVLSGVCGGLAEYFGLDPSLVRIGLVLTVIVPPLSVVGLLSYVVLAAVLPEEGSEDLSGRERVKRNLEGLRSDVRDLTGTVRGGLSGEGRSSTDSTVTVRREHDPAAIDPIEIDRAAAGERPDARRLP